MVHRVVCDIESKGEQPEGVEEEFHIQLTWTPPHGLTLDEWATRMKRLKRKLDRFHERLGEHDED